MIVETMDWHDYAVTVPAHALTAPLFVAALNVWRGKLWHQASVWTWLSTGVVGVSGGWVVAWMRAENRLQGYLPNDKAQAYWLAKKERLAHGAIVDDGWMTVKMRALFGPKAVPGSGAVEKQAEWARAYYGDAAAVVDSGKDNKDAH